MTATWPACGATRVLNFGSILTATRSSASGGSLPQLMGRSIGSSCCCPGASQRMPAGTDACQHRDMISYTRMFSHIELLVRVLQKTIRCGALHCMYVLCCTRCVSQHA